MAHRWAVEFSDEAEQDLAKLDRNVRRRVIDKLDWFTEHFDVVLPMPLGGEYREFYKIRVGSWRVVYTVNWSKSVIIVDYIDRRDKIYKRRRKL